MPLEIINVFVTKDFWSKILNMKRLLLSIFALVLAVGAIAQSTVQGKVIDATTGEPILFGNVSLLKNGVIISGSDTDLDGNYIISADPGTYDLEVSYVGYSTQRIEGVLLPAGKVIEQDIQMSQGVIADEIVITGYKVPLIELDNTTTGNTVTAEQIRVLPSKNLNLIAATSAGASSIDGGAINFRGSRTNGTVYYIDGIRTNTRIPQSEVEQMQVITGGIEAKYGDVTGGIISLTSKGPSSSYSGGLEVETSEGLDNVGYNLLSANLAGPIIKKGDKTLLGFRFSGQYITRADNRVSYPGVYRLSEEQIRSLEENPVVALGNSTTSFVPAIENLNAADFGNTLSQRPNEDQEQLDITAKFDARITDDIDISISGSYTDLSDRFTSGGDGGLQQWSLANWTNNPFSYTNRVRGNFRFRHKIGSQGLDEEGKSSTIQNLFYTIQFGFERSQGSREDFRHEDRLWNYGYLGATDRTWIPEETPVDDVDSYEGQFLNNAFGIPFSHQGYTEQVEGFVPGDINPVLAKYQEQNGTLINDGSIFAFNNLYRNVGSVFDNFSKSENDIITFQLSSGFDILPGGSEKGRHSLEVGLLYEQRVNRSYSINPFGLWELGRITANNHIVGVDINDPIGTFPSGTGADFFDPRTGEPADFVQYNTLLAEDIPNGFIRNVRSLTGRSLNDYINIDGLDPSQMNINLFSAAELNNARFTLLDFDYFGYDYLGNKNSTATTFDDFFSSEGATFDVAPFTPVYASAYIQDKFTFKDIIFRLGVRADYYDANTRVLSDPYSLYAIEEAGDFFARTGQQQPASVADDYKVYLTSENGTGIAGFRQEDQWFLPNGTAVGGGGVLFPGGLVNPSYGANGQPNIQSDDFDPDLAFEDYTPQLNIMPRLAFSFPISDDAGFFAHYDVLTQRPTNNIATALDYYYFTDLSRTNRGNAPVNDPRLRPVRTVDYQVGFNQKLTNTSAIKISAYYRELRDLIQRRFYTFVPQLNNYEAFGNIDFSTVKGFTFEYDRRRVNNLQVKATYTLQFADGSGSDANSSAGLNARGPIRTLIPLNFDERHRVTATLDYRYGNGAQYNGPRLFGKDLFADAGANFVLTTVSGRPFTEALQADAFNGEGFRGAINGARLPWTFNIDMRVDKTWRITTNQEKGKKIFLNAYVRAQNLFNTQNIIGVYEFTGDEDNDGYLASSFGVDRVTQLQRNGQNASNFLDQYNAALLEPGFFALPRRLYVGVIMDF
jgi:hypothetical protein